MVFFFSVIFLPPPSPLHPEVAVLQEGIISSKADFDHGEESPLGKCYKS